MRIRWKLGSTLLGLGLAGLVVVGSSGCGGESGPETGDAVVVPPPAASPAPSETAPEPTPAAPEPESQPASTPATGTGAPAAGE